MDDEQAMRLAIREAFVAREHGEDPFGAVLLDPDGAVCHVAHSRCTCSTEPCVMCAGAIKWAKIQKVVFSVPQSYLQRTSGGRPKPSCESFLNSGYTRIEIIGKVLFEDGKKIFEQFQFTPKEKL